MPICHFGASSSYQLVLIDGKKLVMRGEMKEDNDGDGEARIAYYLSSSFACGWSFENVFKDYYFLVL